MALGHAFATHSDTEVIAHAYEEWGAACLPRLNGDFAFAVWDRDEQELFLARDRFGARPLFVSETGGALGFASEAKALLRHPALSRELDPSGLVECLTTWGIAPDRSAFAGIRELAPAHFLRVGPAGIREESCWWDLDYEAVRDQRPFDELAAELLELLADAVSIRLRADVPVGAYLSGGLDSSLLTALARAQLGPSLHAFGIGFSDEVFDESTFQMEMAAALGTDLNRVEMDVEEIGTLFPRVVALAVQPLLRTAPAPMLRLSGAVEDAGLKVVLTGEGADELFGGYDLFREDRVRRFWARDPESELRPLLLNRLYPYLGRSLGRSGAFLRGFFAQTLHDVDDPLYSHRVRFDNTARMLRLLAPDVLERSAAVGDARARLRSDLPGHFHALTPLARALPRDEDVPDALSVTRAGRPDADGPLHRRPVSVPRPPCRGVCSASAGPRKATGNAREAPVARVGARPRAGGRTRASKASSTGPRSPGSSPARRSPSTSGSYLILNGCERRESSHRRPSGCCSRSAMRTPSRESARPTRWRSPRSSRRCCSTNNSSPRRRSRTRRFRAVSSSAPTRNRRCCSGHATALAAPGRPAAIGRSGTGRRRGRCRGERVHLRGACRLVAPLRQGAPGSRAPAWRPRRDPTRELVARRDGDLRYVARRRRRRLHQRADQARQAPLRPRRLAGGCLRRGTHVGG